MIISDVLKKAGRNKRSRRLGRGIGSGSGKTSGRGNKGMGQHATHGPRILSQGGQTPLFRRLPKRGFSNAEFRTEYQVVNVSDLQDRFEANVHVTPALLKEAGLIHNADRPVKVLGNGEITKKLQVEASAFSASASRKITDAGGQFKVLSA